MWCQILVVAGVLLDFLGCSGQDYILTSPAHTQFLPNYQQPQYINNQRTSVPFRQGFQQDSYLPQRDLQTSDLPVHLQQTLPQYRFTTKPPFINNFQQSSPTGFRPSSQYQIIPSTHRPNYSHLFSQTHNHDPSQTEQFLGEITLQNPIEFPPRFESFKSVKPFNENSIQRQNGFLNHRTRIFADADNSKQRSQTKDYFVNNNGDVFITTKSPNTKPSSTLKPTVNKNSFDLESLLEEPIKNKQQQKTQDDDVEVVPATDLSVDHTDYDEDVSTNTEYYLDSEELEKDNNNDLDEHYEDDEEEDYQELKPNSSTTTTTTPGYEVLTMKPSNTVKEDNFKDFTDTAAIDTTTILPEEEITTEVPTTTSKKLQEPEVVVSVVTTKSVINNTVIPQVTTLKPSTTPEANTTDTSWVVVASVQTSRSVSGARYLPSDIVKQQERIKLLNEPEDEEAQFEGEVTSQSTEEEKSDDTAAEELESTTEVTTLQPSSTIKIKTSTESLIDKLDRVQSDLSSGLLTGGFNNIAVIKENMPDKMEEVAPSTTTTTTTIKPLVNIRKFQPHSQKNNKIKFDTIKQDDLTGLLPAGFKPKYQNNRRQNDRAQADQPVETSTKSFLPAGFKAEKGSLLENILNKVKPKPSPVESVLSKAKPADLSGLLPPDYKPTEETPQVKVQPKLVDSLSGLLPPGYKVTEEPPKKINLEAILEKAKPVEDISSLLPPGFKPSKAKPEEDLPASLLPPGYKPGKTKPAEDVPASLLPPGYKPLKDKPEDEVPDSLLPRGYKSKSNNKTVEGLLKEAVPVDISSFLPPGYKPKTTTTRKPSTERPTEASTTTTKPAGFKVVFPSRPGGGARKSATRTTPKAYINQDEPPKPTSPTIHKGWPSRATTEFTGWPTPSTTPISIEKLLEAARNSLSTTSTQEPELSTTKVTSTTTTTTTTTQKPTTPGVCKNDCDLAGTIKLVGGAKWVPELLDRNTKEYQILANEVQTQLDEVFSKSAIFNKWYKSIRIDGFSKGSVLVDYLVELNDVGRQVDTAEMKTIFHESLSEALTNNREGKSLNESSKLSLGQFVVDPKYTDFIVLPKQMYPTVGYAEDNVLLPQWAIAVIVIGLASLLFVIIFGVTVLVNRQKNAKKKAPTPLTEDMLNELNKNHMGGFDNYGADDLYNMEDVWNDRAYDQKPPKKRSSGGSIHDNSMSNLYDSWRSEWNGYYYNAYYGNTNPGSSQAGYGRRRSDYDTNF